ncbi:MAG: large-conductance mechanosensitive channel protein MscL, partial [Phototrophicaceae bacterium]
MLQEFQKFIMRGNVIDLAVGIIIGTAFTGIVNSLVNDIIMPPIGLAIGGVDFSNLVITLKEATAEAEAVTIGYGAFINQVIQFLIIAFVVFMLVRSVNNMMKRFEKEEEPTTPAGPTTEEKLLDAINDLTAAINKQ